MLHSADRWRRSLSRFGGESTTPLGGEPVRRVERAEIPFADPLRPRGAPRCHGHGDLRVRTWPGTPAGGRFDLGTAVFLDNPGYDPSRDQTGNHGPEYQGAKEGQACQPLGTSPAEQQHDTKRAEDGPQGVTGPVETEGPAPGLLRDGVRQYGVPQRTPNAPTRSSEELAAQDQRPAMSQSDDARGEAGGCIVRHDDWLSPGKAIRDPPRSESDKATGRIRHTLEPIIPLPRNQAIP
jgi:hypothetical protein